MIEFLFYLLLLSWSLKVAVNMDLCFNRDWQQTEHSGEKAHLMCALPCPWPKSPSTKSLVGPFHVTLTYNKSLLCFSLPSVFRKL